VNRPKEMNCTARLNIRIKGACGNEKPKVDVYGEVPAQPKKSVVDDNEKSACQDITDSEKKKNSHEIINHTKHRTESHLTAPKGGESTKNLCYTPPKKNHKT